MTESESSALQKAREIEAQLNHVHSFLAEDSGINLALDAAARIHKLAAEVHELLDQIKKDRYTPGPDGTQIVLWGPVEALELHATTRDEAVMDMLDLIPREKWPETLTVAGLAYMMPSSGDINCLDEILESLEEFYGPPVDGPSRSPTPKMMEAHRVFARDVLAEYRPWSCYEVHQETVNVREWAAEHWEGD